MKNRPTSNKISVGIARVLAALTVMLVARGAEAASATWTNAPVDATWTNINNWVSKVAPGQVNNTVNNGTDASVATFNTPIYNGIGSTQNPIVSDDATVVNGKARMLSSIIFDTTNCGAYVFYSPSPEVQNSTTVPETGILNLCHNGSITLNPTVTNAQTFLVPVGIRLPSSTAGIFNLINNATNTAATLYLNNLFLNGATTRGVTYILDGTNSGTNTIAYLSQSPTVSTGVSGVQKQGTGTWILSGANNFRSTSTFVVNKGTLVIGNSGAFGEATSTTVNSNAVLQINNGVVLASNIITLQYSGTVLINGAVTLDGVSIGTVATPTTPSLKTTSAGDVMTVGSAANAVTGGAVGSVLHVAGPGTVLLGQSDNYVGQWSVDAGTLQLGNASGLGTGASLNIGAGATFDVSPITSGSGTYTLTTSGLSANGTGTVVGVTAANLNADPSGTIDLATSAQGLQLTIAPTSSSGDSTHPALYVSNGTLKLGGNAFSINNASGTPLGVGVYTIIEQANGNVTDGGGYSVVGVTGSGLAAGDVASIQVSGGNVNLVVTAYVSKNLIWKGSSANANWDVATDANWLNNGSASVFNNSDFATFNSTGSAYPTVTLVGTLAPGSLTVDTSGNNYTFTGSGSVAGSTSLKKLSSGTLLLQNVNTYGGGTVVSNGVLQIGVNNAVPDTGGDVAIYGTGELDLNSYNDAINGLNGNGTVDTVAGGSPVLSIGNNDDGGTFAGSIKNTSGTLALTKNGTGTQVLSAPSTYTGATTINAGSLRVTDPNALGSGASALTVNVGAMLDISTNEFVGSIAGSGTIANNSGSGTNELIVNGSSTFNGSLSDGPSGATSLLVNGGSVRLNGNSSYSGGTYVAAGATLVLGQVQSTAVVGTGQITVSNNTAINMPNTGSQYPILGNPISTADNSIVTITAATTSDTYANMFYGSATATNILANGNMTLSHELAFSNFLGTVIVSNGQFRVYNQNTPAMIIGDNTTFNFINGGGVYARENETIRLGALFGDSTAIITGPSFTPFTTYIIGAKNINSVYSGSISGSNSIVKTGSATLVLQGVPYAGSVGIDGNGNVYTNYSYSNSITFNGTTTISNGVLALTAPLCLTNSSAVTLAAPTAILDASNMGYVDSTGTNLITNSIFEVISSQALNGLGTITGNLLADAGSTINAGNASGNITNGTGTGVLNISGTATLNGALNLRLNNTNTVVSDELAASSYAISGASLVVTNVGPALAGGNVFHLFSAGINTNNFSSIVLPTVSSPLILSNKLSIDGSLVILSTVNTNAFTLTNVLSGGSLQLSWPADHIGWRLLVQTNTVATGLGTNWVTWPGSASVNSENIPVNTTNGAVFFRMVYP